MSTAFSSDRRRCRSTCEMRRLVPQTLWSGRQRATNFVQRCVHFSRQPGGEVLTAARQFWRSQRGRERMPWARKRRSEMLPLPTAHTTATPSRCGVQSGRPVGREPNATSQATNGRGLGNTHSCFHRAQDTWLPLTRLAPSARPRDTLPRESTWFKKLTNVTQRVNTRSCWPVAVANTSAMMNRATGASGHPYQRIYLLRPRHLIERRPAGATALNHTR